MERHTQIEANRRSQPIDSTPAWTTSKRRWGATGPAAQSPGSSPPRCLGGSPTRTWRVPHFALLAGLVLLLTFLTLTELAHGTTLNVVAVHDKPGPVNVRAQGWDASCVEIFDATMSWPNNNNTYGVESLVIPSTPNTVRFTFTNDSTPGSGQDGDRNLLLDEWNIDGGAATQGESWTRSFGPDNTYPGCGRGDIFGARMTDCGNNKDWAEYGAIACAESSCSDAVDNNGDGLTDCEEEGCDGVGSCTFTTESICADSLDNDSDGATDCADPDCDGSGSCEYPEQTCNDSLDNDADGFTDCDDTDCQGVAGCAEIECGDSVDDDSDGNTDCADADCSGFGSCEYPEQTCNDAYDNDADGTTDCADIDCDGVGSCEFGTELTCYDSIDNDADGATDCLDADCTVYCSSSDLDADGILDSSDNCILVPNGPLLWVDSCNQVPQLDADGDGFGNACDADVAPWPGDLLVLGNDIVRIMASFGNFAACPECDLTCDGYVLANDIVEALSQFGTTPGP